jgi:hypothetical protein
LGGNRHPDIQLFDRRLKYFLSLKNCSRRQPKRFLPMQTTTKATITPTNPRAANDQWEKCMGDNLHALAGGTCSTAKKEHAGPSLDL